MSEREKDLRRIDEAIELILESMRVAEKSTGDKELDELNASVYAKRRADLAKSLPALFERRSKLLGLDAEPDSKPSDSGQETPVERIRRLAAVPKQG